jgi:hypothetical protein
MDPQTFGKPHCFDWILMPGNWRCAVWLLFLRIYVYLGSYIMFLVQCIIYVSRTLFSYKVGYGNFTQTLWVVIGLVCTVHTNNATKFRRERVDGVEGFCPRLLTGT